MDTISDRHHRCFFGWVHVSITIRIVVAYFICYNIGLALLRLPSFSIYVALIGFIVCFFTIFQIYKKNARLLLPFYLYVLATIFYLLFLGGYFFFVNIFYKQLVVDTLGDHSEKISFIWHFADICLIMLHAWALSVISKCRKYLNWLVDGNHKVELPVTSSSPRHGSKSDIF